MLDLAHPDAYDHVRDQVLAVLASHRIDYIKWDHNRDLVEGAHRSTGPGGVHEQTVALYRLLAEVRAANPSLEIESCAGGGGRIDLAILELAERVWASDCIDPLERQDIDAWTSLLLPPEMIGTHIASAVSHTTGRAHSLDFRAGTAFFGHLGIEWNLTEATPVELDSLRGWVGPTRHIATCSTPEPWCTTSGRTAPTGCAASSRPTAARRSTRSRRCAPA